MTRIVAEICQGMSWYLHGCLQFTIDKSYDVLQLGGVPPNGANLAQKWNFKWLKLWPKYLKDRPDIYREAYHRHKLPSIRGMKATTQDGGNLPQKWNFYWLKLWLKYARDRADFTFEFDTLPIPDLHTYHILIYLIALFVFFVGIHTCWFCFNVLIGFGLDCMHGGVRWFSNET